MSGKLTEEQLRRIEENKKKALAKRAEKLAQSPQKPKPVVDRQKINVGISYTKISSERNVPSDVPATHYTEDTSKTLSSSSAECVGPGSGLSENSSSSKKIDVSFSDLKSNNRLSVSVNYNMKPQTAKIHVGIEQRTTTSNPPTSQITNHTSASNIAIVNQNQEMTVQQRIEENKRKALEKLAEKKKSPAKSGQGANVNSLKTGSTLFAVTNVSKTLESGHVNQTVSRGSASTNLISSLNKASGEALNYQASTGSTNQQVGSVSHGGTENVSNSKNMFSAIGNKSVKGSCVLISRDRFEVSIGFSAPLVQLFKTMDTKLYDAVTKKWSFKLSEYMKFMAAVKSLHPTVEVEPLPKAILQVFGLQAKGENTSRTTPIADLSNVEPTLVNSLMSFQRQGVNFGIWKNGRVLIADDMGLGKTIQAICLACYYRAEWPLLVVVPSSVRFDWAQQFQRWVPSLDRQQINVAVTGKNDCTSGLVNILSYDLMARKATALRVKHFQVIIMDECHLLKNYKTARCKAAMPLLQNSRRVLLLSGTPALSRPSELYTQICAICPFLFKFHDFGVRYCDAKKTQYGWDYSGSSHMAELQLLLEEKIMIRRLKKDVLSELPDKVRQMVLLDPRSIKVNKDLKQASKVLSSRNLKGMEQRGALLDFFHQSGKAKLDAVKTYIEDLLEGDKKFIIFAHHKEVLDGIEVLVQDKVGSGYIRIDGRTNSEQRNYFCKKFQVNDNISVAILSITAANAGLNLSAANLVVFAELFWNPGILVQAEDRAHRIGQQDSVSVHYLVATGTSDDHIWPMIQKKLDVLGKAGLSKDDFSSAGTTHVKDSRQEEIIKFLEESFSEDFTSDNPTGYDMDEEASKTSETEGRGKIKTEKQMSIMKFCSPRKDIPQQQPSSPTKPKGLFKYFSPTKRKTEDNMKSNEDRHENGDSHKNEREDCDIELDMFLNDDDDCFDEVAEPQQKKQRT